MSWMADYVSPQSTARLRELDVSGVSRYLSWRGDRDTLGKVIGKSEFDSLRRDGFQVVLNWEYSDRDWLRGSDGAQVDASEAIRQARELGYPQGKTIIGSADFDMQLNEWQVVGFDYAVRWHNVISNAGYVPGVYGPYDVLSWCASAGVMKTYWQAGMSTAYSQRRNRQRHPVADLRQLHSLGDIDLSEIITPDYGQMGYGMEQGDRVKGNGSRNNTIGDVFADLTSLRDWLYGREPQHEIGNNPPPGGSRLDLMYQAARKVLDAPPVPVVLSEAQIPELAEKIATRLEADAVLTSDDVEQALRNVLHSA